MECYSKPVALRFNRESDADLLQALEGAPNRSARIKALMRLGLSKEAMCYPQTSREILQHDDPVEVKDDWKEDVASDWKEEDLEAILAGGGFGGI